RKYPKAGPTLHYTRCDKNVLVVVEIDLVLRRNSLGVGLGIARHLSVDSYVYRSPAEVHATQSQYHPIKLWPVLAEMPEARLGDFNLEHHSLARGMRPKLRLVFVHSTQFRSLVADS